MTDDFNDHVTIHVIESFEMQSAIEQPLNDNEILRVHVETQSSVTSVGCMLYELVTSSSRKVPRLLIFEMIHEHRYYIYYGKIAFRRVHVGFRCRSRVGRLLIAFQRFDGVYGDVVIGVIGHGHATVEICSDGIPLEHMF